MANLTGRHHQGAVGIFLLIVLMASYIIGTIWFVRRRSLQPIRSREPFLIIYGNSIILVYVIAMCCKLIFWETFDCTLAVWADYFFTLCLGPLYCIRCFLLYFRFELAHERIELAQLMEPDEAGDRRNTVSRARKRTRAFTADAIHKQSNGFRLLNHPWLGGRSFLVTVYLCNCLVILLPPLVYTVTLRVPYTITTTQCQDSFDQHNILLVLFDGLYIAVFVMFGLKLRHAYDNFCIRDELQYTATMSIIAFVLWIPWVASSKLQDFNRNDFFVSTSIVLLMLLSLLIISTIYPLYLTYKYDRAKQARHRRPNSRQLLSPKLAEIARTNNIKEADSIPLQELLADPDGYEAFKQYLAGEFSVENLLFWREIQQFVAAFSEVDDDNPDGITHETLFKWAHTIYDTYILPNSPLQINLPSDIVSQIDADLERDSSEVGDFDVFAPIQSQVDLSLLDSSSASMKSPLLQTVLDSSSSSIPPPHELNTFSFRDYVRMHSKLLHVYDAAVKNIYALMEKDSFTRFKMGRAWVHFFHVKRRKERNANILKEVNLNPSVIVTSQS